MRQELLHDFLSKTEGLTLCGVSVWQDGEIQARNFWEEDIRLNVYSVSKSVTATALIMAEEEGLLSLEDLAADHLKEYLPNVTENKEWLANLRIKHLLSMTMGQEPAVLMAAQRYPLKELDWVSYVLNQPVVHQVGESFLYTNAGPYLAGVILQKVTRCDLIDFLMPRLFMPLGIWRPTWETDPMGYTFGAGGLMLNLDELSKLGQLYLQKGKWGKRQLFSEEWANRVAGPVISTGHESQYYDSYSYGFWQGPDGSYRADGKYGQYSIVLPEKGAVVAMNSFHRGKENLVRMIYEEIVTKL